MFSETVLEYSLTPHFIKIEGVLTLGAGLVNYMLQTCLFYEFIFHKYGGNSICENRRELHDPGARYPPPKFMLPGFLLLPCTYNSQKWFAFTGWI